MRHVYLDLDLDRYVTTFYWGHRATATYCIKQLSLFGSKPQASSEYWIHFTARFGGVHAFGYNSTESEPIWMKSGALRVHCRGLALADFRRDPRKSDSCRARRNFVCFFLSGKQCTISPISRQPNFTRSEHRSVSQWRLSEQNFENFTVKGRFWLFFQKNVNISQKF